MRILVFMIFVITSSGCSSLMLGGGSASSSSAEDKQTTKSTQAADVATSSRVKQEFAADGELSQHQIYVTTTAGMVKLSGSVSTYAARESAEKLAMASDGVKAVDNQITVEN